MTMGKELGAWRWTARIAGVFCLVLAAFMMIGHLRVRAQDPWKSPRLNALKEQLRTTPKDEAVKEQIRALDLKLRARYFNYMSRMETGVYFLVGGAALLVLSAMRGRSSTKNLPNLLEKLDAGQSTHLRAWSTGAVVAGGMAALAAMVALGMAASSPLPRSAAEVDKLLGGTPNPAGETPVADAAAPEEYRRNWPRFLGPEGNGFAPAVTNAPVSWDVAGGKGVLWKVPATLSGFNSPVVWGDRVFYSGGDAEKREVICYEAGTGKTLWREALTDVQGSPAQLPEIPESTGLAASTMATDGRRVYVMFANGDLGAFTLEGKKVWAKYVGPLKNAYGHVNSLATWKDRVIVQLDQGDSEEGKSKLVAYDGRTGQVAWQKPRKVGASWASPIVYEAAGKPQVAVLSLPWVSAYAAQDGAELWKADCLNGEVTPSPIFAAGLLVVPSPSEKLTAFRPDGSGDVTKTHAAWINEDSIPDVTTPASNGELLFMLTTSGVLTAVDMKDGKKVWEKDYEIEFHSSPVIAGKHLYLFSQKGTSIVAEAGRDYKELLKTDMPDSFHASPAIAQDRIFVRGITNTWCISK